MNELGVMDRSKSSCGHWGRLGLKALLTLSWTFRIMYTTVLKERATP
jgi:hypothetical protein